MTCNFAFYISTLTFLPADPSLRSGGQSCWSCRGTSHSQESEPTALGIGLPRLASNDSGQGLNVTVTFIVNRQPDDIEAAKIWERQAKVLRKGIAVKLNLASALGKRQPMSKKQTYVGSATDFQRRPSGFAANLALEYLSYPIRVIGSRHQNPEGDCPGEPNSGQRIPYVWIQWSPSRLPSSQRRRRYCRSGSGARCSTLGVD